MAEIDAGLLFWAIAQNMAIGVLLSHELFSLETASPKEEFIMKRNHRKEKNPVRMELKYCEHCGSLWLRPSGTEKVYCESCQAKVAELPRAKKSAARVQLPVGRKAVVDRYGEQDPEFVEIDLDELDFEAAGGVA